jgi:hypothetical protein
MVIPDPYENYIPIVKKKTKPKKLGLFILLIIIIIFCL